MRRTACALISLSTAIGAALAASGCFVTIDESLLDQPSGEQDAAFDVTSEVQAGDGATTDADAAKTDADAAKEAGDAAKDGDAAPDAAKDGPGEAAVDADAAQLEGSTDDADEGGVEQDGDTDVEQPDAPADVKPDVPKPDGGLVACTEDADCTPSGCKWRKCIAGQCVDQSVFKESVGFFNLAGGESPACNQGYGRSCVVAVGSYVVALTASGLQVFNARNPMAVKQEPLQPNAAGATMLVRSGQRIYTAADAGNGLVSIGWLDLPSDASNPLPPLHQTTAYLGNAPSGLFPYPNDTLLLQTSVGTSPAFARFGPGLPTFLEPFAASDSAETTPVAASVARVLMHNVSAAAPFHHTFSLQTNAAYASTSNTGSVEVTSLTTSDSTRGFFATSRKGSVAWVIGAYDGVSWTDVRAIWLAEPASPTVVPTEYVIETFAAQQVSLPLGPAAFLDESTLAAAVVSAATQTIALDIVSRTQGNVSKRIPMPSLPLAGISVAGDNGYAYVARDNEVHIYAPACNP